MTEPSVAVVVPVLNEISELPRCCEAWRALAVDELLVVDGGSADGTREFLQQSGIRWASAVAGRASQMNTGAAALHADILLFLHADTTLSDGHVAEVREVMRDPEVIGGRFDIALSGSHPLLRLIERLMNWRSRLTGISTGDQAMFVRRDLFERIGGFADQPLMEDVELSRRLKRLGRIACLRQTVTTSSRRWEQHGILRTILLMWLLRLLYWLGMPPARLDNLYRQVR